jgi:hypothetical protein
MPVLHFPGSAPELMVLGSVLVGFAAFAVTLLTVSLSVTRWQRAAEQPIERSVIPARRTETPAAPKPV